MLMRRTGKAPPRNERSGWSRGFSLVELIVVIGIIAILIGLLFPLLARVRTHSKQVACASALAQIGTAFSIYAAQNNGWWPMARHEYAPPGMPDVPPNRTRMKRWYDFISGCLGTPINIDGDREGDIEALREHGSVLWGCPDWEQANQGPGYAMNIFPFATFGRNSTLTATGTLDWVCRFNVVGIDGWYAKASQWTNPSEKCLVYDSIAPDSGLVGWPWWSGDGPMPDVPHMLNFTPDFNRHGGRTRSTGEKIPSINILFCDGHVRLCSARETNDSVLFTGRGN